jgi:hypothetical protein
MDTLEGWVMGTPDFTLADRAMQEFSAMGLTKVRMRMKETRRFNLSEDFLTRIMSTSPRRLDQIIARSSLAYLPFEHVWFEYREADIDRAISLSGVVGVKPRGVSDYPEQGVVGFWISRNNGTPTDWIARTYTSDMADVFAPMPFVHYFGPENTKKFAPEMQAQGHQGILRTMRDLSAICWGIQNSPDVERIMDHLQHIGVTLYARTIAQNMQKMDGEALRVYVEKLHNIAIACSGDIRLLVMMLAAINYVPTRTIHVPRTGTYRKRLKNIPYLDYQCIEIDTSKVRTVRSLGRVLRRAEHDIQHRRAHEVRGHWRYYLASPRCGETTHIWEEKDANHHTCMRCGTRRTWIDAHQRGDASIGYVTHDYEVVK